jgi:hypothetical protein
VSLPKPMTEKRKLALALAIAIKGLKVYRCEHDGAWLDRVMRGEEEPDPEDPPCSGCSAQLALYRIGQVRRMKVIVH